MKVVQSRKSRRREQGSKISSGVDAMNVYWYRVVACFGEKIGRISLGNLPVGMAEVWKIRNKLKTGHFSIPLATLI